MPERDLRGKPQIDFWGMLAREMGLLVGLTVLFFLICAPIFALTAWLAR